MKKKFKTIYALLFIFFIGLNTIGQTTNYDSIKTMLENECDFNAIDTANENDFVKDIQEWLEFYATRLDKNGNIDGYIQNLNDYLAANKESDGINKHWEYIGHTNQLTYPTKPISAHNQIVRIWVDPVNTQHIIAGTLLNGAWETFDQGDNWNCITDSEPKIRGISSIEVKTEGNTTTIYLTSNASGGYTPPYSIGLFYTSDDGVTWNEQQVNVDGELIYPRANVFYTINQWMHYTDNVQFLLTNNYFYRSNDGGATFEEVFFKDPNDYENGLYSPWEGGNTMRKMLINPSNPNELFISGPELLKYNITTGIIENLTDNLMNGVVDEIHMTDIARSKINNNIIWFMGCKIKKINNNTFFDISMVKYDNNTNQYQYFGPYENEDAMYFRMFETSPFDDDHISIGNRYNDFYSITNGFNTLYNVIHFDIRASVLINENNHLVQIQGTDGGIGKVTYSGTVPELQNATVVDITNDGTNGIINYNMNNFDVSSGTEDDMMLLACSDNSTLFEKNGNWKWLFSFNGDGMACQFSKSDPTVVYSTEADINSLFHYNTNSSFSTFANLVFSYSNGSKIPGFTRSFVIEPGDSRVIYTCEPKHLIRLDVNQDYNSATPTYLEFDTYPPDQNQVTPTIIPKFLTTRKNSGYFYVCTDGLKKNGEVYGPMLLKVSDDLSEVTDLTESAITAIDKWWTPITSIALDPYNIDRFWISLGAISEGDKVYVTNDDGASFEPMGNGLPNNFPVNEIILDERTNMLFAANDVGVYFYDENNSVWKEFTGDMPPVFCNFVRFSPDHKNIRLGSKGRGPWETSSCFYEESNPLTINTNTIWENPKFAFQDIIIESGATLTIKNNVFMPSEAKIIVERGAQLIIDGGTLTNACEDMWDGIEVWGTYNRPQSLDYQGLVRVENGGTIENAVCGIRAVRMAIPSEGEETPDLTYTGGIVWADNSYFRNNKTGVRFYSYHTASTSHFNNCIFSYSGELLGGVQPDYHVRMSQIRGIIFTKCEFTRNDLANQFVGSGIYAYNSRFSVEGKCTSGDNPCTQWESGIFRYLKYGIYSISSIGTDNYADIRHQSFSLNRSAVYIGTEEGARITSNTFVLPEAPLLTDKNYYGLYLDRSTKYHVEDNSFEGPTPDFGYIGIYINESGDNWNQIYNNTFSYLCYGTLAYGDNRKGNETGLCIKCNDYDHTKNDITVNGKNPEKDGIAYNQGFLGLIDTLPAGNTFSSSFPKLKYNYYNSDDCGFIEYVYHESSVGTEKLNPDPFYNTETMYPHSNDQVEYDKEIACPSKLETSGGGGSTDGDRQAMTEAESHISQDRTQLSALVDGGNTDAVTVDVVTSTPPEAGEVYQNLMSKSPYLSDTVMKTAISKENVLPNAMVRDVLVANPHSAKDKGVINLLDERFDPMPQWMKDQILQGVSLTGLKESIESDLARWTNVREEHFSNIYRRFLHNMQYEPSYYDSLVILLGNENSLDSRYDLAFLYLNAGDNNSLTALLNELPTQFEMNSYRQSEYQDYITLFGILTQFDETGIPDSSQLVQLGQLSQNDERLPGAYARSILIDAGVVEYTEPIDIPDELKSSSVLPAEDFTNRFDREVPLNVYPNPAKDYIIVDYDTQGKTGTVVISVNDMKGNIMDKEVFGLNRDQRVISTKDWKRGIYIVTLIVNGSTVKSVKVTVQ